MDKLSQDRIFQGVMQGCFLFSMLFALTLYMFKRSENYLIPYAVHTMIPQVMAHAPYLAVLFSRLCTGHAVLSGVLAFPGTL